MSGRQGRLTTPLDEFIKRKHEKLMSPQSEIKVKKSNMNSTSDLE